MSARCASNDCTSNIVSFTRSMKKVQGMKACREDGVLPSMYSHVLSPELITAFGIRNLWEKLSDEPNFE